MISTEKENYDWRCVIENEYQKHRQWKICCENANCDKYMSECPLLQIVDLTMIFLGKAIL